MRPDWNQYFMFVAKVASSRSTCNSRPIGAVIVKNNHILSTGYNGSMHGSPHCIDQPDPDGKHYCHRRLFGISDIDKYNFCVSSHAEANAITQAARYGISIEGSTLYTTLAPCYVCLKLISAARIRSVYYELPYESSTPERDRFWQNAVQDGGFEIYEQLSVSQEIRDYILNHVHGVTSERKNF